MSATKSASSIQLEQGLGTGRSEEDESTVQNLIKAASDVTAALFALELIKDSNTSRAEMVSKAPKLLSEASEELKKALCSPHP
jgi:hypothetical protein